MQTILNKIILHFAFIILHFFALAKRKRSIPRKFAQDEAIICSTVPPVFRYKTALEDFNAVIRHALFRHTLGSGSSFPNLSDSQQMSDSLKILMKKAVSLNDLRDVEFSFVTGYFNTVSKVCQGVN